MARHMPVEVFKSRMQAAMEEVKKVLHVAKVPRFAADVHHQYDDKYLLAERLTNTACASQLNCLEALGLTAEHVAQLAEWSKTHSVSLRFHAEQHCTFAREATRDVQSAMSRVKEVSVTRALQAAFTSRVVHTVTEYFWKLDSCYKLEAVRGTGREQGDRLVILQQRGQDELMTTTKQSPHPEARVPAATCEMNASWLFRQLVEGTTSPGFRIDREGSRCHTPRRNPCVDSGFEHFVKFARWASEVDRYMVQLLQVQPDPSKHLDFGSTRNPFVFVPLLPLFEEVAQEGAAPLADAPAAATESEAAPSALAVLDARNAAAGTALLAAADMNRLLEAERRALHAQIGDTRASFPSGGGVGTSNEAVIAIVMRHCQNVCSQWSEVLDYVEGMLREQLISAIGRKVTPADFAEYMRFHSRKLFAEQYAPAPFCFAVRRSERHSPEGTLSIEEEKTGSGGDSSISTPVITLSSKSGLPRPMHFALNASTHVSFGGDVHLHGYLCHQFSGQSGAKLSLVSRARQFSSFLVLVGRIASAHEFEPKYAAIVKNKDELTIPLGVSTIPTPKEFKDAIESLSPEQQNFAKAFRAMQLESTLFGIVVIQIKPQLEKVLNLPPDSLTKEIKLTQDLMKLFIEYQIPSDLLSFDGRDPATGTEIVEAGASEALEAVRGHVKAMHDMIENEKKEEIEEMVKKVTVELLDLDQCSQLMYASIEQSAMMPPRPTGGFGMLRPTLGGMTLGGMRRRSAAIPEMRGPDPSVALSALSAAPRGEVAMARNSAATAAPMPPPQALPVQQPGRPMGAPQAAEEHAPGIRDYTQVPKEMDARFEKLDADSALRPTIITPCDFWTKSAQKGLLAAPVSNSLAADDQKREKDAAFDLLDALTKSGALQVDYASLHVVIAATHCFDKTVTETVVQDSINPIEKVERSMLIMASTVHQRPTVELIQDEQRQRVESTFPPLFLEDDGL